MRLQPHLRVLAAAAASLAALASCDATSPSGPEGRVAIDVAPLTLDGISDAVYTLTVVNALDEVVWTRTIRSSAYGDGAGSVSYVGTCDASQSPNEVQLVVDALEVGGVPLVAGVDWMNPTTPADPLVRAAACVADQDTAVTFDISLARAAQQGFFDVAVSFSDVFCSAKLDCKRDNGGTLEDLLLLTDPLTGQRDHTVVLGFACTAGPGQETLLHLNPVVLTCAGGVTVEVDPSGGPGNLNPAFPGPAPNTADLLFQSAIYRGVELLGSNNKAYWNVALGLNLDAFGAALAHDCALTATGTVSEEPFVGGASPDGTRWPYVDWNVPVIDAAGAIACERHEVGGGDGVSVLYSATSGISFAASYHWSTGDVETYEVACTPPHCASGGLCEAGSGTVISCDTCDPAWYGPTCASVYTSCLDHYNAGATVNGTYDIDPDGAGPLPAQSVTCDMANGGWTLVAMEDFESATSGWTNNTRTTCGSYGTILGGYNVLAGGTDQKTYSLSDVPHTEARLEIDYIKIDSWDGEIGRVTFGGTILWSKTMCFCTSSCDLCGSEGVTSCGSSSWSEERRVHVSGTIPHSTNSVVVAGSSTLDQAANDESWGLDNVYIYVR